MFGEQKVNLRVTDRTRAFLDRFKARSRLDDPVLGISWGRVGHETDERWTIGLYDRKDLREGWLGIAPDFDFVVVQDWALKALDDKVLDFDEDTGIVTVAPL
jgi:hypothetical protein